MHRQSKINGRGFTTNELREEAKLAKRKSNRHAIYR